MHNTVRCITIIQSTLYAASFLYEIGNQTSPYHNVSYANTQKLPHNSEMFAETTIAKKILLYYVFSLKTMNRIFQRTGANFRP